MNEIMQQALAERQRREKEEKAAKDNKSNTFDFGKVEYIALENKVEKVFRLIGAPPELRTNSSDMKFVLESQILKDDKKGYVKLRWPFIVEDGKIIPDPDFILTKLYRKVYEGEWRKYEDGHVNEKGKSGEWFHYHKETDAFKRIAGNGKEGDPYPKKFYPSVKVVSQGIDRHDNWCAENKKLKILTSKSTPYEFVDAKGEKKTIFFRDTGIPKQAYDALFDHYTKCNLYWEDTDCIIVKRSETKDYVVWDKQDQRYLKPETISLAKDTPLTDEEKSYEKYDLDKMYGPTSYSKIKKNIGGLFKLVDIDLGTTFYDELCLFVDKEVASNTKKETDVNPESHEKEKQQNVDSPVTSSKYTEEQLQIAFPNFSKLTPEEQLKMREAIKEFNGTIPIYHTHIEESYCMIKTCCFSTTDIPTTYPRNVLTCPVCGVVPTK